jgi:hypothetical protein
LTWAAAGLASKMMASPMTSAPMIPLRVFRLIAFLLFWLVLVSRGAMPRRFSGQMI